MITYATKIWGGEWASTLKIHYDADLIIGNNLGNKRFIDMGKLKDYYYLPELEAVKQCKTKYIVWYSGDVVPPPEDWTKDAIKLLKKYPVVSPFWEDNFPSFVATAQREHEKTGFNETKFGFEDHAFSDQAYMAETETMKSIDYECDHKIKEIYPQHGGNSFERRIGQWLATTGKKRAVLKDYQYQHIIKASK